MTQLYPHQETNYTEHQSRGSYNEPSSRSHRVLQERTSAQSQQNQRRIEQRSASRSNIVRNSYSDQHNIRRSESQLIRETRNSTNSKRSSQVRRGIQTTQQKNQGKNYGYNGQQQQQQQASYNKQTPNNGMRSQQQSQHYNNENYENNENIDINAFGGQTTASKSPYKNTAEKKSRMSASHPDQHDSPFEHVQTYDQRGSINYNQNTGTEGRGTRATSRQSFRDFEDVEKMKKEIQELTSNNKKLKGDLITEKKKVLVLEKELDTMTNSITEERTKYQGELVKISTQIKKLRNVQNMYVNEKKNSEKLETQLNSIEKTYHDQSSLLCECLKGMSGVLEILLVKGDYFAERQFQEGQEFSLENYLKLLYEIRRLVLPKLETAEGFNFNFEWKSQDYKQVVINSKELMKARKATNFRVLSTKNSTNSSDMSSISKKSASSESTNQNRTLPSARSNLSATPGSNIANVNSQNSTFNYSASAANNHTNHNPSLPPSELNSNTSMDLASRINHINNITRSSCDARVVIKQVSHSGSGFSSSAIEQQQQTQSFKQPMEYVPLQQRVNQQGQIENVSIYSCVSNSNPTSQRGSVTINSYHPMLQQQQQQHQNQQKSLQQQQLDIDKVDEATTEDVESFAQNQDVQNAISQYQNKNFDSSDLTQVSTINGNKAENGPKSVSNETLEMIAEAEKHMQNIEGNNNLNLNVSNSNNNNNSSTNNSSNNSKKQSQENIERELPSTLIVMPGQSNMMVSPNFESAMQNAQEQQERVKITTKNVRNKSLDAPFSKNPSSSDLQDIKNRIIQRKNNIQARRANENTFEGSRTTSAEQSPKEHVQIKITSHVQEEYSDQNKSNDNKLPDEPQLTIDSFSNNSQPKISESPKRSFSMPKLNIEQANQLSKSCSSGLNPLNTHNTKTVSTDISTMENRIDSSEIQDKQLSKTSVFDKPLSSSRFRVPERLDTGESSQTGVNLNEYALAKFDYNAQKENDLSFNKGDKIQILKKTKSGWWIGLTNNKIGYFPFNFVNVVE